MEIEIYGKEKKFNIRSWEDEGNSTKARGITRKMTKNRQVGVLETKEP